MASGVGRDQDVNVLALRFDIVGMVRYRRIDDVQTSTSSGICAESPKIGMSVDGKQRVADERAGGRDWVGLPGIEGELASTGAKIRRRPTLTQN